MNDRWMRTALRARKMSTLFLFLATIVAQPSPATGSPMTSPTMPPTAMSPSRSEPARPDEPRRRSSFRDRLARVPSMLGDAVLDRSVLHGTIVGGPEATFSLPFAGGVSLVKIAESNSPVPGDRVYATWHAYDDVFRRRSAPGPGVDDRPGLSRFTVGAERTLDADQRHSVELRYSGSDASSLDLQLPTSGLSAGGAGDLTLVTKHVLWESECGLVSAGLGIQTPTGSSAAARLGQATVTIDDSAVHLLPYLACLEQPTESIFWHAFVQLDFATNGHDVRIAEPAGNALIGRFDDQPLLHVDLGAGYWLMREPGCFGVAMLAELHYSSALSDTDVVTDARAIGVDNYLFDLRQATNRFDALNLTLGLHIERGLTSLRIGTAIPLADRLFAAEGFVQAERRF